MNNIYSTLHHCSSNHCTLNKCTLNNCTLNQCKKNTLPLAAPAVPAPPLPASRKKPPLVNRNIKPEIITFIDGIVEESY